RGGCRAARHGDRSDRPRDHGGAGGGDPGRLAHGGSLTVMPLTCSTEVGGKRRGRPCAHSPADQTRRSTAVTRPRIVAASPSIGEYASFRRSRQTWADRLTH